MEQRYKDSIKDYFKDTLVEIDNYFIPFYKINKRINNNYLIFLENMKINGFAEMEVVNEIDGYNKVNLNILNIKRRN